MAEEYWTQKLISERVKNLWGIIPGRCTKYVHAPKLLCNKLLKGLVFEGYDAILASALQVYSEQADLKSPTKKVNY